MLTKNHTFTIENTETGEHRSFRIEQQSPDATFAPGKRILSLKVGPRPGDFKSFAFVAADGRGISVWKSKRAESEQPSDWEKYAKLLLKLQTAATEKYSILEACPCRHCGELLTVPKSIRRGIGPVCAGRE